jgi:hypothetical protein
MTKKRRELVGLFAFVFVPLLTRTIKGDGYYIQDVSSQNANWLFNQQELTSKLPAQKNQFQINHICQF